MAAVESSDIRPHSAADVLKEFFADKERRDREAERTLQLVGLEMEIIRTAKSVRDRLPPGLRDLLDRHDALEAGR